MIEAVGKRKVPMAMRYGIQYHRFHHNGTQHNDTLHTIIRMMEKHAFKNVINCLNTNFYSYLDTSGQSYNPYLKVVQFFNTSVN
jgi:hypothetical protein